MKTTHTEHEKLIHDYILEKVKLKCKREFTQADWALLINCSRPHFNKWINGKIVDWQITFFVLRHFGIELTVDFYSGKYYEKRRTIAN